MSLRTLFDGDHQAFRESVQEFVSRSIAPRVSQSQENKSLDRQIWIEAGKQGYLGLEVPAEFGGTEAGDYRFNTVLNEELSKVAIAYASCLSLHYDVVAPYLVDLTTPEQKQRWLPGFCSGEYVSAIAMTEPSGGSDLAALKTTAVRDADGWLINGSKTFITNGFGADLVVVAARTSPEKKSKGISLFVVETGTAGFEAGRKLDKVGLPEADTAELFFSDVRVTSENLLGEEDLGFKYMMQRLPQERIGAAVSNLAQCRQILDETLEYAKTRQAFGRPVGSFQANKFLLAEMFTEVEVTQAFVDQAVMAHVVGKLSAVDAAKAKWWSAQTQNKVLDACVQLYGGYGYMREYRVARAWMDARVTKIWAGSNEIMKELIGRDLGL